MRNAIAALVALAALAAAVWVGLEFLQPRIDDGGGPTNPQQAAQQAVDDFAVAWTAGDETALVPLVHPDDRDGLGEFLTATEAMVSALDATVVSMGVGPVSEDGQRRSAEATITVTLPLTPDAAGPDATETDAAGPDAEATGATSPTAGPTAPATGPESPADTASPPDGSDGESAVVSWTSEIGVVERQAGWFVTPSRSLLHPALREDTSFARITSDPVRASLLDINGTPLTSHADLVTLGIVPGQIDDPALLVAQWGQSLPNSQPQLEDVLDDELVADWFYPVVSVSQDEAARVWPRLRSLPGVARRDFDGTTTGSSFGVHVLGRVALPTAEQIQEWGVPEGEPTGVQGLERALDDRLVGASRSTVVLVDGDGDVVEVIDEFQSSESGPVATSLDADVQRAIESALLGVDDPVAIVAVRTDGGIAGAASRPVEGFNRAFEGQYAPGDVLTPMTGISLVAAGSALDAAVDCPPTAVVAGAAMEAPRGLGLLDLRTAIASGCDTGIAALVRDLEPDLTSTALALGFGQEWDLPLPATVATWVEPIDTTEAVRAGVGQARVLATPLLMATMAAEAIAEADLTPWLLQEDAVAPTDPSVPMGPMRAALEAGLVDPGTGVGLLPATTATPAPGDATPSEPGPSEPGPAAPAPSGTATGAADGGATTSPAPSTSPEPPEPALVGAISGTGMSTGSTEVHSWVLAAVGDMGIAILVEDAEGDLALAGALMQRVDRELVELRG